MGLTAYRIHSTKTNSETDVLTARTHFYSMSILIVFLDWVWLILGASTDYCWTAHGVYPGDIIFTVDVRFLSHTFNSFCISKFSPKALLSICESRSRLSWCIWLRIFLACDIVRYVPCGCWCRHGEFWSCMVHSVIQERGISANFPISDGVATQKLVASSKLSKHSRGSSGVGLYASFSLRSWTCFATILITLVRFMVAVILWVATHPKPGQTRPVAWDRFNPSLRVWRAPLTTSSSSHSL